MAYSTQTAVSDGTLQTVILSIAFFDKSEIRVYRNGVEIFTPADFVWATPNSIQFSSPQLPGVSIQLRRTTDISEMRHIFTEGAQFNNQTLDEDYTQMLHIAQESREGVNLTDLFSDLNMHQFQIKNLKPGVAANDAVTVGQIDALVASSPELIRAVRAGVNESPLNVLPPAASRANHVMGFDAAGQPAVFLPVDGSATSFALDLANSLDAFKGASLVGYRNRTARAKMDDVMNINDYGAVPGTDATAAIMAAIADAPWGGEVFIPGHAYFATHITVNKPLVIHGPKGAAASITFTSPTGNGLEFSSTTGKIFQAGVADLRLSSNANSTSGFAFWFGNIGHSFIENVYVHGNSVTSRPYGGVMLSDVSQTSVHNLQINDCASNGLTVANHCVDIYFTNSRSDANGAGGILIQACEGLYFTNVSAYFNDGVGWRIQYNALADNKNMFFNQCVGDSSGSFNWLCDDLFNAFWVNSWGCTQKNATAPFASGFYFSKNAAGKLSRLRFVNNVANNNNTHGFSFVNADHVSMLGNTGEANGVRATGNGLDVATSTNVRGNSNYWLSNTGRGINVGAACNGFAATDGEAQFNVLGSIQSATANILLRDVAGYKNSGRGNSVVPSGSTSVVVAHGLDIVPVPAAIFITPTSSATADYGNFWITDINATTFTLRVRNDPGVGGISFNWAVIQTV